MKYIFFFLLFGVVVSVDACLSNFGTSMEGDEQTTFAIEDLGIDSSHVADNHEVDSVEEVSEKPKKVIKNIEYYLLAGFFALVFVLYFFVLKKK